MCWNGHSFVLSGNDLTNDIETLAFHLREMAAEKIFGSLKEYHDQIPFTPSWITYGGIDSDIKISRDEFDKLIRETDEAENQLLYYHDLVSLIGSMQNAVQQAKHLMGEFYRELNRNSFMLSPEPFEPDMTMIASGLMVTSIFSFTNHLFITLYSQLDFISKICFELENLQTDFSSYPKLKSSKILYGDSKRLKLHGEKGTLFEDTDNLRLIQTLRNEIVHNGSFENIPKVFLEFRENHIIEKFIFLPDFENGIIKTVKNRKRFFDDEVKLNELLPELIFDFWERLVKTLTLMVSDWLPHD
ncbi:hypothetical protein ACRQ5D_33850 [Mucilaginibacter sp. P25]|uniref:hypothetical protein n=1 Tax=Mucilaginibacter sp. P25 TaxID=3423945 RepID=UPI003D7ACA00